MLIFSHGDGDWQSGNYIQIITEQIIKHTSNIQEPGYSFIRALNYEYSWGPTKMNPVMLN